MEINWKILMDFVIESFFVWWMLLAAPGPSGEGSENLEMVRRIEDLNVFMK